MAKRTWVVQPDHEVVIGGQLVAVVSREAMVAAYMDAEAIQARMGGLVTSMVGRAKTGVPGEAVTTGAIFEWKSNVNARPEPEAEVDVLPRQADPDPTLEELEQRLEEEAQAEEPAEPDGLDVAVLEEEDLSAIPVEQR